MTNAAPGFLVELDVFSGRPNPSWPLTPDESRELLARMDRLEPDGPEQRPVLGYRGFIVYRTGRGRPQRWLNVGHGTVSVASNNRIRHFRDAGKIEEWLRDQAIERGFGALFGGAAQ